MWTFVHKMIASGHFKSLSITFLVISDHFTQFIFKLIHKIAAVGHICRTMERFSPKSIGTLVHRRSKAIGTLVHRRSMAIGTLVHRRSMAIGTLVHRRSMAIGTLVHRRSMAIGTLVHRRSMAIGTLVHRMSMATSKLIWSWRCISDTVMACTSFSSYFHKMAAIGYFPKIDGVLPLWATTQLWLQLQVTKALACDGDGGTENILSTILLNFGDINIRKQTCWCPSIMLEFHENLWMEG